MGLAPPPEILELLAQTAPLGKLCCFDQHPNDAPAPPEAREAAERQER